MNSGSADVCEEALLGPPGTPRQGPRLRLVGRASAVELDRLLLELSGRAARCRFVQGRLATLLLANRGWRTLGFVRLSDYSRERLGIGARAVEESARVSAALEKLPRMTDAFLNGTLSWTSVRLVAGVASARDEAQWIERAMNAPVRALTEIVRASAGAASVPTSFTNEDNDDPSMRWSVRASQMTLRLWRAANELAQRVAGSTLTYARVLELVAAEAASAVPSSPGGNHELDPTNASLLDRLRGITRGDAGAPAAATHNDDPVASNGNGCFPATTQCDEKIGTDGQRGTSPGASSSHPPFDWREGLEARDPQLAAFLTEPAAEKSSSGEPCAVAAHAELETVTEDGISYDWRRGLEERDPELAALLVSLEGAETDDSAETDDRSDRASDGTTDDPGPFPYRSMEAILADIAVSEGFAWLAAASSTGAANGSLGQLEALLQRLEDADPFTLDARLRQVRSTAERVDAQLASLLREAVDGRLYRELGFASLDYYVESRLGICPRSAWNLLAIERATRRSPLLAAAWGDGQLSSLAARTILPVLGHCHDRDWILRAQSVTLRRLEAEVAWTLERIEDGRSAEPPPDDVDLTDAPLSCLTIERLQMCSRPAPVPSVDAAVGAPAPGKIPGLASPPCTQVTFFAPQSVVILAEETMLGLRVGSESRAAAFERMLALAILEWMKAPTHRDPVFARDGWRCAVPGCSSRRNLHDHHVIFRSRGGGNGRDNRITVCAAHHLHGLHRGRIRACGAAPQDVVWELGVRFGGGEPLARLRGDRYLDRRSQATYRDRPRPVHSSVRSR